MTGQSGFGRPALAAAGGGYGRASNASSITPSGRGQVRPAAPRARRMHCPAAVALIPRLAAILRLERSAADASALRGSVSSVISVLAFAPRSHWKTGDGSPNGVRHACPQTDRDRPGWVVAINRRGWSQSSGASTLAREYEAHPFLSFCFGKHPQDNRLQFWQIYRGGFPQHPVVDAMIIMPQRISDREMSSQGASPCRTRKSSGSARDASETICIARSVIRGSAQLSR